jgi:hypothetical protein
MAKTTVLYIAGWGRSGSTVLANILGQLPGFFCAGELVVLWELGIVEDATCGCGVRFSMCPVWGSILGDAFGGIDRALALRMMELRRATPSNRDLARHALVPRLTTLQGRPGRPGQAEYAQTLSRLYSGIANHGANRVIVDSSKGAPYLYMLGQVPDLDVRIVHLVRDPRATAFSWLRHVEIDEEEWVFTMAQHAVWRSARQWVISNALVPIVAQLIGAPVKRIRYESFVANPQEGLRQVLSMVDDACHVSEAAWPFVASNEVELKPTHTVWGNPKRQRTGRVQISPDNEWVRSLGAWRKAVVTGLTYPLARHYGYFSGGGRNVRPGPGL